MNSKNNYENYHVRVSSPFVLGTFGESALPILVTLEFLTKSLSITAWICQTENNFFFFNNLFNFILCALV